MLCHNIKGFKVGHINTGEGGLIYHIDEVHKLPEEFEPDVLACSETWLDDILINQQLKRIMCFSLTTEGPRVAWCARCGVLY